MHVGDAELVATSDIKDGAYVSFSIHSNQCEVRLHGKKVDLDLLGISNNTPLVIIKDVLSKAKICQEAPG